MKLYCLPMLLVYGHYKYVYSYSAGIDSRRQILTSRVDPRTKRVKHPQFYLVQQGMPYLSTRNENVICGIINTVTKLCLSQQ